MKRMNAKRRNERAAQKSIGHKLVAYRPPGQDLFYYRCTICELTEGELTPECCGEVVSGDQLERLRSGRVTYLGGQWQRALL